MPGSHRSGDHGRLRLGAGLDLAEFHPPDMSGPLDLARQRSLVMKGATVKGMQLNALVTECSKRGKSLARGPYRAFFDYPGEELVEILPEAAALVWPGLPLRQGLRRIGRLAYPTLRESLVGRVVFGAAGRDVAAIWRLVSKGYQLSASHGSAELLDIGDNHAVVRLADIYSYVDCWHVGILEGALSLYGLAPDVSISIRSPTSADFLVRWDGADEPEV